MKQYTLKEIIEKQKNFYQLTDDDEKLNNRLITYFSRLLKSKGIWQDAPTRKIGKQQVKLFDEDTIKEILDDNKVQSYLIKQRGGDDIALLQQIAEQNKLEVEYRIKERDLLLTEEDIAKRAEQIQHEQHDKENDFTPNSFEIQQVMVEALFNQLFELDVDKWSKDKALFHDVMANLELEPEGLTRMDFIIASQNLKTPYKAYVKPKQDN